MVYFQVVVGRWLIEGNPKVILFDINSAWKEHNEWRKDFWNVTHIRCVVHCSKYCLSKNRRLKYHYLKIRRSKNCRLKYNCLRGKGGVPWVQIMENELEYLDDRGGHGGHLGEKFVKKNCS